MTPQEGRGLGASSRDGKGRERQTGDDRPLCFSMTETWTSFTSKWHIDHLDLRCEARKGFNAQGSLGQAGITKAKTKTLNSMETNSVKFHWFFYTLSMFKV